MTNKTGGISPDIKARDAASDIPPDKTPAANNVAATDKTAAGKTPAANTASKYTVGVIGGGAAGLMAAGYAAEQGAEVTIFEHRDRLALKLGITGKGRCNVTNDCDRDAFLQNVPTNPRFLYTALAEFSPSDTMEFFTSLGVELKVERGNRVFPVSDKASDIVRALKSYAGACRVVWGEVTRLMLSEDGSECTGLACICPDGERKYRFDRVIVATGGVSYQSTGSRGAGYALARQAGLAVIEPRASLVPL
ncbi:MAG: aminoacetone oxidase family FAD-binding enzyme, partial [Eubacteriales bacterium]